MGLSAEELDIECDEIFKYQLIEFKPRRDNSLDKAIAKIINDYNITIPIVFIRGSLYLVGTNRVNLIMKREFVLVRAGGGYIKLYEYIPQNNRFFMRQLVVQMIKSGDNLDVIVKRLVEGEKIAKYQDKSAIAPRKSMGIGRSSSMVLSSSPVSTNKRITAQFSMKQYANNTKSFNRKSFVSKMDQ